MNFQSCFPSLLLTSDDYQFVSGPKARKRPFSFCDMNRHVHLSKAPFVFYSLAANYVVVNLIVNIWIFDMTFFGFTIWN